MLKNGENAPRVCKNALICALGKQFEDVSVHVFDEIDSTNTEAKRMALDGFLGDALLVAHRQTAGRGRMGRRFYSPDHTGAYFSILHALKTPLCDAVAITSAASVAVMRALRNLSGVQTEIKWVNDLYYNGKKICGILTEATSVGESTHVIVGIGINLNTTEFPEELTGIAGSLGARPDPNQLIAEIYCEIIRYLNNPAGRDWLADYRAHSCVIGRRVAWTEGKITRIGTAESIDEEGALLIKTAENEIVRLHTGEISLRPLETQ
jgi:BirA family biotin operon repressor/biotin-[acetyl-CoA-carboxylase] ligase